jgi:transposase
LSAVRKSGGRVLRDQGHQVRLMSPEYVRPYVKGQKNDDRDAEAIAEAATRPATVGSSASDRGA